MRISISVVASNVSLTTDLIPMDVFPDMTFNDIKALVEGEINVPPASQHFFYNDRSITDTSKTLEQLGVGEGDMLGMAVGDPEGLPRRRQRDSQQTASQSNDQQQGEGQDVERMRLHIIGDPRMMAEVRRQDPELADVANNKERFYAVWDERKRKVAQVQAEKNAQFAMLNADPFNAEAQKKIEEMIQQERIQENTQKALEENPESFGRVVMLYIDVLVNNVPIKAFVDSGAQTTIMSPDAAERCGIMYLVDKRFGGIAKGVGTARILGRVHTAELRIGPYSLASSFTVMEGKDVDLLLGLDMLKRHQMCIDLKDNCLLIQNDRIRFLTENEMPKMFDEILENEPMIEGPEGTQIGARTGTVEQTDQSSAPSGSGTSQPGSGNSAPTTLKIKIHPAGSNRNVLTNAGSSTTPSSSSGAPQPRSNRAFGFGQRQKITQESIDKITALGFSLDQAILALQEMNGDVELAVGLLI